MFIIMKMTYLLFQKGKDFFSGLNGKTIAGRPNWDEVFTNLKEQKKGKVTVFYCGNPTVARLVRAKCQEYDFEFCKEVF